MEALLVMIHTSPFSFLSFLFCSSSRAPTHPPFYPRLRIVLITASGQLGPPSRQGVSYSCFPRLHQQLIRQRLFDLTSPPVLCSAFFAQADFGRFHWIPQHWQVLHHQHPPQEEGVQRCPYSWRDQGLAIHYLDEAYLPHRLSRCRSSEHGRYR